jgi:Sulfotransferase family
MHVGKTGGTAINTALEPLRNSGRYEIVLDGHHVDLRQIPSGEKFFFVLRDPLERFVSGFNDRQRCSRPRYNEPWTLEEERAYGCFQTPDALGKALSSDDQALRAAAHEAMTSIYHVKFSYWYWFRDPDYFESRLSDLLLVMWLPSLHSSFARLCTLLGLPELPVLPTDEVGAHRNPATAPRCLSDGATENLRRWYHADFQFVEMCARLDQATPELRSIAFSINSSHGDAGLGAP